MDMAELLGDAKRRGYTLNFAFDEGKLRCPDTGERFGPDDATIVYSQAVDEGTDPGDDATLYLIEADGRKGYLMVSDSFHADPRKAAFIDRLLKKRGD